MSLLIVLLGGDLPILAFGRNAPPVRPTIAIPRVDRAPSLDDFLDMKPSPKMEGKLAKAEKLLKKKGFSYIKLNTSHAFHSEAFDPIMSEFADYIRQFTLSPPETPFISCFTGTYISGDEAVSPEYWSKQLRNTVRFRSGISELAESKDIVFVEVGSETHLSTLVKLNENVSDRDSVISTIGKQGNRELVNVIEALGKLFVKGFDISVGAIFEKDNPGKISLPSYPWDRKSYWIDYRPPLEKDTEAGSPVMTREESPDKTKVSGTDPEPAEEPFVAETGEKDSSGEINSIEKTILEIWYKSFMNNELSVTDDFFDLGGDSLLAITVTSKMKTALRINLPLNVLYERPNIRKLAELVAELRS